MKNLPPNMLLEVIGQLSNNEAIASLAEVNKELKKLTKEVLNQRRMQKIKQQFRKNKNAVFHNDENVQHKEIVNKMQHPNSKYKVGDVVMFNWEGATSTREYAFAVVSYNNVTMRKTLVSNEGLTHKGLPNYVLNHVRTLDYTKVEKQMMKKFAPSRGFYSNDNSNDNSNDQFSIKGWVKHNIIGTPHANRYK